MEAFLAAPVPATPPGDGSEDAEEGEDDWGVIAARLQRFYHAGDPAAWLTSVPVGVVEAYARAMPRLKADEALVGANQTALGANTLKPTAAKALEGRWMRLARGAGVAHVATRTELVALGRKAGLLK